MNTIKNLSLCMLLIGMSGTASAESYTDYIKHVYATSIGDLVITFQNDSPECQRADDYHHVALGKNGVTAEGLKNMIAVVLAASLGERRITITFDATPDYCYVNKLYLRPAGE